MRAVNLLTEVDAGSARRSRALSSSPATVGAVGGSLVVALLVAGFVMAGSSIGTKEERLAQLRAEEAALPPLPAPSALAGQRQEQATALAGLLSQRVSWDRLLDGVARVMPSDVWLSSVSAQAPPAGSGAPVPPAEGVPEASAAGFIVSGYTTSQAQVARVITHLALLPQLADIKLQTSARAIVDRRQLVQFTVAGSVRLQGDAR